MVEAHKEQEIVDLFVVLFEGEADEVVDQLDYFPLALDWMHHDVRGEQWVVEDEVAEGSDETINTPFLLREGADY